MEFDGWVVSTKYILCLEKKSQVFSGHEDAKRFLKAPIREIENSSSSKHMLMEWMKMLRHLNRKANAVVFMKYTNTVCAGKLRHAVKMYSFLKQRNFKLFKPEKSADHPDHYATFLELCKDDDQD